MNVDVDQRRQELEAELAAIAEQEREQAKQQHLEEQKQHDTELPADQLARKQEIERRAQEQLDREFPPAWMPQKQGTGHPSEIVGLVLRIDPRVGPSSVFGTYSAVVEVRDTGGKEWTIWANESGALYAQLVRLRVQPGEVVGVRYRGKKESQANPGQSYHDFRLVRVADDDEGPAAPVDYDQLLQRDRDTPALPEGGQAPAADDDIPF